MSEASFPGWEAHPDVWLLVGLLAAGYAVALARVGPALVRRGDAVATGLQKACFAAGLVTLLVASDWPIHDVGERSLYSAHMVQHLALQLVAAPLLLMGTPTWLARWLLGRFGAARTVRALARFFPALVVFNLVVVFIHWPVVVEASLRSGPFHLFVHTVVLLSGLLVWLPVVSPLPEVPRLAPLPRMLFLFLQSVVPTLPASFLTFGEHPLYRRYEDFAHLWGISAVEDMQIAGLIMKIGAGTTLWVVIAIVFFRWYAAEEAGAPSGRRAGGPDRELENLGLSRP